MEGDDYGRLPAKASVDAPARREWVVPLINGLTLVSVAGMALGALVLAFTFFLKLVDRGVRVDLAIGMTALGILTFLVTVFMLSRRLPLALGAPASREDERGARASLEERTPAQIAAPREPAQSVTDYTTRSLRHPGGRRETV